MIDNKWVVALWKKNQILLSMVKKAYLWNKQKIDKKNISKLFYMFDHADFSFDLLEHDGILTYYDDEGKFHLSIK